VNAVFDRAQPGVVNTFGVVNQTDVDQHHHRPQQQSRWIREVLARTSRRRSVNRFKHRNVLADIC